MVSFVSPHFDIRLSFYFCAENAQILSMQALLSNIGEDIVGMQCAYQLLGI